MRDASSRIIVVGGGLVGASLALALAPLGYEVVLLEAVSASEQAQPSYDDRTLALGGASCRILEGLGLWSEMQDQATPITSVVVSELGHAPRVDLDATNLGLGAFGHVVEARAFGQAVLAKIAAQPDIEMLCPVQAESFQVSEVGVAVSYRDGDSLKTVEGALLIGADGADSLVRQSLDIPVLEHDYGQTAIIANVTPSEPHAGRAFERLTSSGPFALLPHRGERCGLVWCVESSEAASLLALNEDEFLRLATARSGGVLGTLKRLGRRSSYALRQVVPERGVALRALLMGNAAHAIHPVGAQGFNLGLRDVATLAEVLADARLEEGALADPGNADLLHRYSQWRSADQAQTVSWTDDMVQLFASEQPLTRVARVLSLGAIALSPTLQRRLALRAMGFRGRSPRLALGESLWEGWGDAP